LIRKNIYDGIYIEKRTNGMISMSCDENGNGKWTSKLDKQIGQANLTSKFDKQI
jgi:hypothetical protein